MFDALKGWQNGDTAIHYVLGETKENVWLAEMINANNKAVTVIDSRYKGGKLRNGISYTNMEIARATFDIPARLYFHSYMDPKNRKKK